MKILSPAGNFESLKMAVYNGADEVYLGINNFNARNNIDGFSLENLEEAVDFAHVFGVKVNLAINILFDDDELQEALDTIVKAYNLGVDCFIIQDLGLVGLVHENYPEIEIHASTQMAIHNLEGVQAIEKYGFKRVVLARETPLDEIKRIHENSNVEIEYFAQGALCVSFSGNCYISSYLCAASGNRGKCKQLCRLPYTLEFGGKQIKKGHLLSAKEFNMIHRLDDLKKAGVNVLKIEGRARRPFYVGVATREYYNALNGIKTDEDALKLAFNREYTAGYFDGNGKIISGYHNHIGIQVGRVEKVNNGKKFNEVFFSSNRELSQKSTFKLFKNGDEKNTLTAYDLTKISNGKYKLTTTQKVDVGDNVHLILDARFEEEVLAVSKKKKIKLQIYVVRGKPIWVSTNVNGNNIDVMGHVLEPATNQPLKKEDLISNFKKSDLFDAELEIMSFDNIFIPNKLLNEFRRKVFDEIFEAFTKTAKHELKSIKINKISANNAFSDFEIVENIKNEFKAQNVIYSPEEYNLDKIKQFKQRCEAENKKAFLDLPNFALKKDIELIKKIIEETKIGIIANNYYALNLADNVIVGAGLNVYNSYTATFLKKPFFTAESDLGERVDFPYMTLRHCPMQSHLKATCANCPYKDGYTYKMDNGKILKLKRKKLSTCTFYLV